MASPQKENGYTSIANDIVEALAMTYLSSYESQILFAILRKTYGWNKKDDWISGSQLAEMTGIKKGHVSRTLKKLILRNMITKNDGVLSFQKDYDLWQKLPKQVTIQRVELPKQVTGVTQTGNKKLPKQVTTKDNKDTIQKTPSFNKGKKGKRNEGEEIKDKYSESVYLTKKQYEILKEKFGNKLDSKIEALNDYIKGYGKERAYKSHYHVILVWDRNDKLKGGNNGNRGQLQQLQRNKGKYEHLANTVYNNTEKISKH